MSFYNIKKIRKNFPIIEKSKLIYLDNASTTYKPINMIKNIIKIYLEKYSSYNRGLYTSSFNITNKVEKTREIIANFINSKYEEIIFTSGSTESLNMLANILTNNLSKIDNVILSYIEHHSNILPWKILSNKIGFKIKFININKRNGNFKDFSKIIDKNTKIISISHMSNILGIVNNIEKITKIIKKINNKIIVIIDGSQAISHIKIDVKKINCDFYIFSGHKIYAPLGIGILYGKKNILNKLNPWKYGGSMVKNISKNFKKITYMDSPWKFESGSINITSILGLKSSIEYINKIGIKNINIWEKKLTNFTLYKLKKINGIIIYPYENKNRECIISFNIENIDSNDISMLLNLNKICIRTGHHCSIPLMNLYKVKSMCRISYAMYTNYDEISFFIKKLKFIIKYLNEKKK